ncbi:MAG: family 10 glycosylhydrolase [candidate division KSB1 bacterium]|nr:family 10 glycosylhydrolase [candidate division KSB1 bacterium]MDZ7317781.1 family 10 glycosylhydrolase [candidate division KSB1 bacterium]MDZ7341688.1 family 10 glycosylhydrolase [candidate division KSB1 bacterium]
MKKTCCAILLSLSILLSLGTICKEEKHHLKEARGLWVTRWEWAVKADTNRMLAQQARIRHIFELAKDARLNFILFQVRGNGDAFYQSPIEPWSDLLSDSLGADPGWDPLAFAVELAHELGLELHAWFNTFPAWRGHEPPPHTTPEHVYHRHPEWLVCDKNGQPMPLGDHYVSLSPGIPEVRDYLQQVALDIVTRYDIDGIHFDYIRYPESADKLGYSQDPISLFLFNSEQGNPQNLSWENWQRENINQFVRQFYDRATAAKPWLKISAAVIGKYDQSDWNGYHAVFQDARRWLSEGKMDFIVPMIYWPTNHPTAPYGKIVDDWFNWPHERFIFPGMMVNSLGSEQWPTDELFNQVAINRRNGNGMVFFSYSGLEKASQLVSQKKGFVFLANLPPMTWKDDVPPMDPQHLRAEILNSGQIILRWSPPLPKLEPSDVFHYNIFRSEKSPVDFLDAENLIHVTAKPDTFYIDASAKPGRTYHYVVTALDRVGNESPPSNQAAVALPVLAVAPSSLEITAP